MSQADDSPPATELYAGVTWYGAVLVGIPLAFVAGLLLGTFTDVFPRDRVAYGAAASLVVTGYAIFRPPVTRQAETQ